jgi:hypothetical protein
MTRAEAICVLLFGVAVVTAACTWMFGGWGLLGGGVGFMAIGSLASVSREE